jgi:hypothetical protein
MQAKGKKRSIKRAVQELLEETPKNVNFFFAHQFRKLLEHSQSVALQNLNTALLRSNWTMHRQNKAQIGF